MNKKSALLFICVLFSVSSFAADRRPNAAMQGGDPINANQGSDSCGLGWEVAKDKTIIGTWTRATTNSIAHPSFSMTSGTSGCQKHPIAAKEMEAATFVASNSDSLKGEIVLGNGEYIQALSQALGCGAASDLGSYLKSNYSNFSGANGFDLYDSIRTSIRANSVLSASCVNAA